MHALERVKGKSPPPPASSELRPVSLIRGDGDKMLFTTPRRPLPLKLKLLEHIVLHWDWQLAAQRYTLWVIFTCPFMQERLSTLTNADVFHISMPLRSLSRSLLQHLALGMGWLHPFLIHTGLKTAGSMHGIMSQLCII